MYADMPKLEPVVPQANMGSIKAFQALNKQKSYRTEDAHRSASHKPTNGVSGPSTSYQGMVN